MSFPVIQRFETPIGPLERNFEYDFDQEGSFAVLSPALAIRVLPRLSLGISLNIWNDDITGSSHFRKKEVTTGSQTLNGRPDPVHFLEKNEITVDNGYSAVLGALYRLNEIWAFGAVIKPAFELELNHKITMNNFKTTRSAELEMPFIFGAGIYPLINSLARM